MASSSHKKVSSVINPEIRKYLRDHNFTEIAEAILTGLLVTRPNDSLQYIEQQLEEMKELHYSQVKWDMLVPVHLRPKVKPIKQVGIGFDFAHVDVDEDGLKEEKIFTYCIKTPCASLGIHEEIFDDDIAQPLEKPNSQVEPKVQIKPTAEDYSKACAHYNNKLMKLAIRSWCQFVVQKKEADRILGLKMARARACFEKNLRHKAVAEWKNWVLQKQKKVKGATTKLKSVFGNYVNQVIFESWFNAAVDAKKTKEYFEKLELGAAMAEDPSAPSQDESKEGEDRVTMLPQAAASKIFGFLNVVELVKCALVCHSWKMIIQSSTLWNRVDFNAVKEKISDQAVISLLNTARPFIVHLNLRDCTGVGPMGFSAISQCRNLQDINLSGCNITDETMEDIAYCCTNQLLYLNISRTNISNATLRFLSNLTRNLQYLSLAYCPNFTDKGLYYLAKSPLATKLRHLDCSGCTQLTDSGYQYVASSCSGLTEFRLNLLPQLGKHSLKAITDNCSKLQSLSLIHTPVLMDDAFQTIGNLTSLTWLRIEGNQRVTDIGFKSIASNCECLKFLYIVDCPKLTDISLRAFAGLRNLETVNFADCIRVSDAGVRALVEGPSGSRIRELNLTNCVRVSDISLHRISQKCPSLTYLVLCYLEHITEAGLEYLANIPTLHLLDISGCNIQDTALQNLSTNLRVRQLCISENPDVTNLGIQKYVNGNEGIEMMDLSLCPRLTDSTFKNIAYSCRRLTVLNIAGCYLIGDLSIQYLSGACPCLNQLDASACVDITDKSLKFIKKGCKRLQVLVLLYCKNLSRPEVHRLGRHVDRIEWSVSEPPSSYNIPASRVR